MVFVAPESSFAVLNFDDRRAQFEVTQGTIDLYVHRVGRDGSIEVDTPNLAFVVRRPGQYRIDVRAHGESTAVAVLRGEGEAFGTRTAYMLRAGQGYRFYGTEIADYDAEPIRRAGAFDSWVATRVRGYERSTSARYVSQAAQAAPAAEPAPAQPQEKHQGRRNRDDDNAPPGQRGKGRD